MRWHLHVTVTPHKSWSSVDVTRALEVDIRRHGIKPLVITNHLWSPPPGCADSYRELIPTKEIDTEDEAEAAREIFKMGVLMNNSGWRVQRLKIEGDPRDARVAARALYFETHLKNAPLPLRCAPLSTTAKNTFHTLRRRTRDELLLAVNNITAMYGPIPFEVEAAVLDTNPALDDAWLNQGETR